MFPRTAVWIQHEGGAPFVADSNIVPLYNAGQPYSRREISADGDRTDWFGVTPSILRELLDSHDPDAAAAERRLFRFDFARATPQTFISQRQVLIHTRAHERPETLYVEESVIAVLEAVLAELYGVPCSAGMARKHRELAEAAKAHLNTTYCDQVGLTALARSVGSSPFHLCRVFRQYAGLTIHRYRSELRLRKSLELLDETDDDILTTAMTLGYSGHSHFTGAFHRAFRITPSEFRALSRNSRAAIVAR